MRGMMIALCLFLAYYSLALAQTRPNSLTPTEDDPPPVVDVQSKPQKNSEPLRLPKGKVRRSPVYEYYVRMEEVAKEKQKLIRELSKPQYSDFSYFGHRRPPKRRPFYKMRYCAECGIRH